MQLQRELQRQQQVYKLNRFLDFEAILFLKKCDYRLIHSQTVIDTYFTLKNLWPDVFQDRNWAKSPQQQGILDTM